MIGKNFRTISVVGLGYIGLPTAAVLASRGPSVVGVDINEHAVQVINSGGVHIIEPGLDVVVQSVVQTGKLRATTKTEPADAFIIAVPTPFKGVDHVPDISYVEAATKSIAPVLKAGNLVILESTSPVGTTERICELLSELRPDLRIPKFASAANEIVDISVAYCPERVLPGNVLTELIDNDRVIGGVTSACAKRAASLYKIFVKGECVLTNVRTAEMTKLTENSFRDVNIAFANELSIICEKLSINPWELISLANRHPRVNILQPGPGVGGHCISVDPWFIVHKSPEEARLIRTAREVNDSKPKFVIDKIRALVKSTKAKTVSFYGLSFKPNIDDLRESPAVEIVHSYASELLKSAEGQPTRLLAVEPYVQVLPPELREMKNVSLVSLEEALSQGDVHVFLVNHKSFLSELAQLRAKGPWVDTRGDLKLSVELKPAGRS